ncbi:MAG: glycine cleavage T C-terminal barrel domain-containing protein [Planctomycetota bacterium]
MASQSPIQPLHDRAEALMLTYGEGHDRAAAVVDRYAELEVEYASIRKSAAILDLPHRGTIEIHGTERLAFLNNMLTQELNDLAPMQWRRSLWLNRKGRVEADLRICELGERMRVEVDSLVSPGVVDSLGSFVFAEDVEIREVSESMHRFTMHGPGAAAVLESVATPIEGPAIGSLASGQASIVSIAGAEVVVEREDDAGEVGLHLSTATDHARSVYEGVLAAGVSQDEGRPRARPIGWHAYNIARLEAGTPIFNLDFGVSNLPAETGLLDDRVSFTKGCYLGQEVVARMHSLGHPKQTLVAVRAANDDESREPAWQPETGAAITKADTDADAAPIGAITSCTRSPMLGDSIIALAMVKWGAHEPGTELDVRTPAGVLRVRVQDGPAFWQRPH